MDLQVQPNTVQCMEEFARLKSV